MLGIFLFGVIKSCQIIQKHNQNRIEKTYLVDAKILNSEKRVLNGEINENFLGVKGKISDRFYVIGIKIPLPKDAKKDFVLRDINFSVAEKGYYEDFLKENSTMTLTIERNGYILSPSFKYKELETIYIDLNK